DVYPVTTFGDVSMTCSSLYLTSALKRDGTVWTWGYGSSQSGNGDVTSPVLTPTQSKMTDVVSLACGESFVLAVKRDGTVWGWGDNNFGELGTGTTVPGTGGVSLPVQAKGLTNVVAVAAGRFFSLALKSDGTVWSWGDNSGGQLGDGTTTSRPTPAPVSSLSNVVAIDAIQGHGLAVKSDGTVWWLGGVNSPTQIAGLTNMKAVAAGDGYNINLALKSDGTVWSFGGASPSQVLGLSGVTQIDAGSTHGVALKSDGTVWTWGNNASGQLGRGLGDVGGSPQPVPGLSGAVWVSAGYLYTTAVLSDGTVRTWGDNVLGQLGDGTEFTRTSPVQVSGLRRVAAPSLAPGGPLTPVFSNTPVAVTLGCPTDDAIIHYTTNGAEPTEADPSVPVGGKVTISASVRLTAKAFKQGWQPSWTAQSDYYLSLPTVQFAAPTFTASEGGGSAVISVTRVGDASAPVSVEYFTVDDPAAVRCDVINGTAYARCDYATTVGTLTFAPGETQKSFTVPLIDDGYAEPTELAFLGLRRPVGATLGGQSSATLVIQDNDSASQPNPILGNDFFVRQQYLDFLSREPEPGQPWSNVLNNCAVGNTSCDRVTVSSDFFLSPEFQLKGLFVFKFYKVAFGRMPLYSEVAADMSSVTGSTTAELIAKKGAFTSAWSQRQELTAAFGSVTNQQFVDTLMGRYNLQSITTINPSSPDDTQAPRVTLTRANLASGLDAGTLNRGQVVRALVDSNEVNAAEFNPAFVAMQYFGYLRRDPEPAGYSAWLNAINANPSDTRAMVNGFVNSQEYRLRFGQP
ncbi:MAG: chitobiase/beta-hexosaminidase C-terminal domain-containing protein, partial [Acidobacteriota bacterium]|nr:chitobiase/beta-hexosaminidase C-terminal domain-containing protein [Acidobacteriota bacterium]